MPPPAKRVPSQDRSSHGGILACLPSRIGAAAMTDDEHAKAPQPEPVENSPVTGGVSAGGPNPASSALYPADNAAVGISLG